MKKIIAFLFALSMATSAYSYTWNILCPDSINATNISFGVEMPYWVICSPDGMYLYNYSTYECEYYTYGGLPITEAAYFSWEKMLVVMGNGSWSDGIYTFDFETHQFEFVEWCITPNFLKYHEVSGTYFVGYGGCLLKSTDGVTWTDIPFFNGKSCVCMDFYGEHLAVSDANNIYWSDDSGNSWNQAAVAPIITDIKFNNLGGLYGIFPDYSNSSGLWRSEDFGDTWQIEFYSDNMSAVGFDAFGHIFAGWMENEGIARYDPLAPPPGLTFLNEGLPSININKILMNPTMSAPAIFCCTDGGVAYCYDYMVGINQYETNTKPVSFFPNPFNGQVPLKIKFKESVHGFSCTLFDSDGNKVYENIFEGSAENNHYFTIDPGHLKPGIYFCLIDIGKQQFVEKLIVLFQRVNNPN